MQWGGFIDSAVAGAHLESMIPEPESLQLRRNHSTLNPGWARMVAVQPRIPPSIATGEWTPGVPVKYPGALDF